MEIRKKDLGYEVYERLKTNILANEFAPGEKLNQEQIAQIFGISRMPLHKAFQMLENEMLLEFLPRRGFYVTKIDNGLMFEAFECREALEGLAIRRTTQRITERELVDLKALFTPFVGKKKIDIKKYINADKEFQNLIVQLSGNRVLQKFEVVKNITSQTYRGGLIREPEETLPEHLAIIDAISKGDANLAEQLMRKHQMKTQELIKKQMDKDNS